MFSLRKWLFDKLKNAEPEGEIKTPVNTVNLRVAPRIHSDIREFFNRTTKSISNIEKIDELLNAPKVEYNEDIHTRGITPIIKGLGVIFIIFDSESGEALFAFLSKEIEE